VSDIPLAFWDVLPTICEVSCKDVPDGMDGISFLPALLGKPVREVHESLYWEFPSYGGQAALIKGDWKLLVTDLFKGQDSLKVQLFNLEEDIDESNNLSGENKDLVKEMLMDMRQSHIHSDLFPFRELEDLYHSN
jgi:arylsulfatase A-like enzyme